MNNQTKSLFISIVGKPNVGKSTLLNSMLGSKISIVSSKPQTTRNKIIGILTHGNIQIVFTDTPGIHSPKNKLGNYMISEINASFAGAEACLHVVEAGRRIDENDEKLVQKLNKSNMKAILVINKIDALKDKSALISQINEFSNLYNYSAVVPVSARTGDGKAELLQEIFGLAQPSVFFFSEEEITNQTERMLSAEIIREKLLRFLDKELPHGTAVCIEKFKERENGITDISALIYCEKPNHKGIIIGKNGTMLKNIATCARKDLEEILGRKVNLQVWVKVKENWRNSDSVLHNLGYQESKD